MAKNRQYYGAHLENEKAIRFSTQHLGILMGQATPA
jgi:hypothetical protein